MQQENQIIKCFNQLRSTCEKEDFKGYDPFDGLNSTFFQRLPYIRNNRLCRLAWLQFFKRSPMNFRPLFGVKKDYNPKGLGLFLSGYCNLYKVEKKEEYLEKINYLISKIMACQSNGYSGACWGYNFDWQARIFSQPKYSPTIVATSFIANALLDAYELNRNQKILDVAVSSCDFILNDLNRTRTQQGFIFSYSPLDSSSVYNASLLGARLLARTFYLTKNKKYLENVRTSVLGVCEEQNEDGSWFDGREKTQRWIDNFHTAYNIECINDYQLYTGDYQFSDNMKKGLEYYIKTFFTKKGEAKYYDNQLYPIDIHSYSQFFITLYKLNIIEQHREIFDAVYDWALMNMFSKKGFFYYQKRRYYKNKISYMRWSQAWMFYALSLINLHENGVNYTLCLPELQKK